ncbi:MAG TPA: hypothetical protein VGX28_16445 [Frankiaceae bacterium]|jgi:hypothetical protein|nr:hypothetical protein [Frankiaceae bacterium]
MTDTATRPAAAPEPAEAPHGFDPAEAQQPGPVGLGDNLRRLLASSDKSEPLYPRLLRLKHVQPAAWQRALLVEGMMLAGGLVALADKATSWSPLILPVAAAVVVKFHDVLAGLLPQRPRPAPQDEPQP